MIETGLKIQLGAKVFRKAHAGQVTLVGAIVGDFFQVCGITIPYPDETAAAGELQRQCRAPRAGANYRDWPVFVGVVQWLPPLPPLPPSASPGAWLCA